MTDMNFIFMITTPFAIFLGIKEYLTSGRIDAVLGFFTFVGVLATFAWFSERKKKKIESKHWQEIKEDIRWIE